MQRGRGGGGGMSAEGSSATPPPRPPGAAPGGDGLGRRSAGGDEAAPRVALRAEGDGPRGNGLAATNGGGAGERDVGGRRPSAGLRPCNGDVDGDWEGELAELADWCSADIHARTPCWELCLGGCCFGLARADRDLDATTAPTPLTPLAPPALAPDLDDPALDDPALEPLPTALHRQLPRPVPAVAPVAPLAPVRLLPALLPSWLPSVPLPAGLCERLSVR